jgi:hypothetical protein
MTLHSTIIGALPTDPAAVHPARHRLPAWNIEDFSRNEQGMRSLIAGAFDASDPDTIGVTNTVSMGIDPYLIRRPEGRKQRPGVIEQSEPRLVTHLSVERGIA